MWTGRLVNFDGCHICDGYSRFIIRSLPCNQLQFDHNATMNMSADFILMPYYHTVETACSECPFNRLLINDKLITDGDGLSLVV